MRVSVIIPTLNAGFGFRETLDAIFRQRFAGELEVIVVDSGSTDGTVELCREYPIELIQILPEKFGHGRTRNLGISHARGEFVVLLVQDASPANEEWLNQLLQPFTNDSCLVGVYSRQIPRSDADIFTQKMFALWGVNAEQPVRREIQDHTAYVTSPWQVKAQVCAFSDVSSCLRRSVWERFPLPDLVYAEDLAWAQNVLEAGYALMYNPRSTVIHSHRRAWLSHLERAYIDGQIVPEIFDADIPLLPREKLVRVLRLLQAELSAQVPFGGQLLADLSEGQFTHLTLSPAGIFALVDASSPWMPDAPASQKWQAFTELLNAEAPARSGPRLMKHLPRSRWETFFNLPLIGPWMYRRFWQISEALFLRSFNTFLLFWLVLSDYVAGPLPVAFTEDILAYSMRFLPLLESELANLWMYVLIDIGGKLLGQQAYALNKRGVHSDVADEARRWIMNP